MAKRAKGQIFIGTSNVVIPGNKTGFPNDYQDKSRLHYYSTLFNSVEINSSFYKIPLPVTFEKWSKEVSDGFQFSIKFFKEITHAKELQFEESLIFQFMNAVSRTGEKLGPLLIQFPGKITVDYYNKVENMLEKIRQYAGDDALKIAVEFRHPGWYVRETTELLDEYNAALVLHDIPKSKATQPNQEASFVYQRMHGVAGDYRGSYDDATLQEYAAKIKSWAKEGKDVYCYFNNTIGSAFDNARSLQAFIEK